MPSFVAKVCFGYISGKNLGNVPSAYFLNGPFLRIVQNLKKLILKRPDIVCLLSCINFVN
jgi:hypothetical protein